MVQPGRCTPLRRADCSHVESVGLAAPVDGTSAGSGGNLLRRNVPPDGCGHSAYRTERRAPTSDAVRRNGGAGILRSRTVLFSLAKPGTFLPFAYTLRR